jgi:molybdate transport system substrate-binding protein
MRYLPWLICVGSLGLLGGFLAIWWHPRSEKVPVVVHTAAALRPALERAAPEFERDTGVKIELRFGASEGLLQNLKQTRQGDLFLPADDSYVTDARRDDLVDQEFPLATLTAVTVIRDGYWKDAKDITWDDLFRPGFRLVQPNPDATAIGRATREGLKPSGLWARIEGARPPMLGTVTEAANAVKLGSADGAIIWDAVAVGYPMLKVVPLPQLDRVSVNVSIAMCKHAVSPAEARRFAEYLAGTEGQAHFRALGYAAPRQPKPPTDHGPGRGRGSEMAK